MSHPMRRSSSCAARAGALFLAVLGGCESNIGDAPPSTADSGVEDTADARVVVLADAAQAEAPDAASPDAAPRPCVEGLTRVFNEATGSCYFYLGDPLAWDAAQAACVSLDAHLATFTSALENAFASQLVDGEEPWIGASDSVVEGTFTWVTAEPFAFAHWRSGEPNNGGTNGEDCAVLEGLGVCLVAEGCLWDDRDCAVPRDYVCERP